MVVIDLKSGQRWERNANDRFHPASTLKVPVALYALSQYTAGRLDWQQPMTYTEADYESPGGDLEDATVGTKYPVSTLIYQALAHSNNIALNILGRELGWQNIRDYAHAIGGDLEREDDGTPQATAASAAAWWRYLLDLKDKHPDQANLLLGPLAEADYNGRIAAGVPNGVSFLHKYGTYDGSYHDTGVVMGKKPFIIAVYTDGMTIDGADAAIADATRITYNYFNGR